MSRTSPEMPRHSGISLSSPIVPASEVNGSSARLPRPFWSGWNFWAARAFLAICIAALCYRMGPFGLRGLEAAGVGFAIGLLILLAERQLRRAALNSLLGGAFGALLGVFTALLITLIISHTSAPEPTKSFLEYMVLFVFGYLGLVLGSQKSGAIRADALGGLFAERGAPKVSLKLLDTSVLIDGRIADICEAQFLDGVLVIPQFVLHELQLVADSADPLKRQRGRRGLEVLQRIQKIPQVEVRIVEDDFPQAADVDHKLIELARRTGGKIVTTDFNLNKVATVQGLSVLNVNQLANALKPVVLPGEQMRVFILREGKEANQGVAYLDDGTMVVIDGARRFINKTIDIAVTSVHQTTAGKMIFGRLDERMEHPPQMARHAAAGAGAGRNEISSRINDSTSLDRAPRPIFPETDVD
ncbi:MAG TPA: PIN domain-containing protein [Candidatus Acidoferrum sp.]|nr:PIN domain-containing protein [Candidatus Acidoferrum sp.]